jgi:glycosyltransferase involved in cell wall biosynthesis
MRILMFDNEFPPLGGGTGVVNLYMLEELAKYDDVTIDLVTSSRSKKTYEKEQFAERITVYKVPVNNRDIHHSANAELIRYAWRGLFFSLRLMSNNKYDVGIAFAGVPAGWISYLLNRISGLPYLISLQGPDVPGFERRYEYLYPYLKPILRMVWHRAEAVIALNDQMVEMARQTLPNEEFPIVPNGIDTNLFRPKLHAAVINGEVNILCVGRLIERKGQHHLLRAFAELTKRVRRPFRLTLAGKGDAEDTLRKLALSLGINDAVTFAGLTPIKEMPGIYQNADIFVLPSFCEGMSIGLLEAMASALPIIVTANGGSERLVTNGRNGFVVPWGNVTALTDALVEVVNAKEMWPQMGAESRSIAEQYSWRQFAEQYLDYCRAICSGTRNRK